jgi:pyruvate/2-oxoglutarate dehydrogenase complex dihydrolipoamide acyltransferase (E2) component
MLAMAIILKLVKPLVDFETSKAVVTVDADYSGYVKTLITKGSIVKVGTDFLIIADSLDELSDDSNSLNLAKEASTTGSDKHQNDLEVPIAECGDFSAPRFSDAALNKIKSENLKLADHEFSGLVTLSIIENKLNPLSTNKKLKTKKIDFGGVKKIAKGPIVPREESVSLAKLSEIEQLSLGESGSINSTISVYLDICKN